MSKQLKDYLHLYLPIPVELDNGGSKVYNRTAVAVGNMDDEYRYVTLRMGQGAKSFTNSVFFSENRVKPILRPLSDMTEKEALGWASLKVHPMRVLEILQITNEGIEFKYESFEQDRKVYALADELSSEMFRLLLKAGFDLFGLIDAGLAIDKTKHTVEK